MEDLFDLSNLQVVGTTVTEFIIGLLLTSILSILIKNIYLSFSNSVSNKSIIAKELLYFIKVILTKNNIYNFTDPAREIGDRQFINNLNKKLPTLYNEKNFLFKLYNEMMNKI